MTRPAFVLVVIDWKIGVSQRFLLHLQLLLLFYMKFYMGIMRKISVWVTVVVAVILLAACNGKDVEPQQPVLELVANPNGDVELNVTSVILKDNQAEAAAALQGMASGVQVINSNGKSGGGAKIRIRGGSSLNASNDPLYMIDGVQVNMEPIKSADLIGLRLFIPFSISMQVLRDIQKIMKGAVIMFSCSINGETYNSPEYPLASNKNADSITALMKSPDSCVVFFEPIEYYESHTDVSFPVLKDSTEFNLSVGKRKNIEFDDSAVCVPINRTARSVVLPYSPNGGFFSLTDADSYEELLLVALTLPLDSVASASN